MTRGEMKVDEWLSSVCFVKGGGVVAASHRRRSRASPVLTAIRLVNGKPWEPVIFDPPQIRHTSTDH